MQRSAWTVGLWLALAGHALAQAHLPLELDWQAPAECGSAADVRAELERIARALPDHALAPLRAQARVERRGRGFALQLATEHEGERGERELQADDCATLVRSLTLVLALAFGKGVEIAGDASSASGSAQPPAPQAPAPEPAQPAEPAAGAADAAASASAAEVAKSAAPAQAAEPPTPVEKETGDDAAPLRVALLLGAGMQLALMPEPSAAGVLGVELAGERWSAGLRGSVWPGSTARVGPALDARFDGFAGALQGCGWLPLAALELGLCASASAAALRGRSEGAFEDGSDTAPWLALSAAAAASWPRAGLLRVRLEAALAASLARHRFVIENFGAVHRVPLLAPQLGALLVLTP